MLYVILSNLLELGLFTGAAPRGGGGFGAEAPPTFFAKNELFLNFRKLLAIKFLFSFLRKRKSHIVFSVCLSLRPRLKHFFQLFVKMVVQLQLR